MRYGVAARHKLSKTVALCRTVWYNGHMKRITVFALCILLLFGCTPIANGRDGLALPDASETAKPAPTMAAAYVAAGDEVVKIELDAAATGTPRTAPTVPPTPTPTPTPTPAPTPEPTPTPTPTPDPNRKLVALTFDDGPSPTYTEPFLDIIEKYGVHVTFFLLSSAIHDDNHATVQRMIDLGCEIGCHGLNHDRMVNFSRRENYKRFEATKNEINSCIEGGYVPILMRPPGGQHNADARHGAADAGLAVIMWSVDSCDWQLKNKEKELALVKQKIKDGSIVLFHDRMQATLDTIDELIPWLWEQGYELVTVSELIRAGGEEPVPGKVYKQKPTPAA